MAFRGLLGLVPVVLLSTKLGAQQPAVAACDSTSACPLVLIGSWADDSLRLAQLLGRAPTAGYLLRSPSAISPALPAQGDRIAAALVGPVVDATYNSAIPYSINDGSLWAGRGLNSRVTLGARLRRGRISLDLAPEIVHSENRDFFVFPSGAPGRSTFASPWHSGALSADLPLRFGRRPLTMITPGQTTLTYATEWVDVGASTENQWWGPGIRNAIVMSNNAQGIPHLFARTRAPIRTRIGDVEAKVILGALTESLFFDTTAKNDLRSLSGIVATLRPAALPDLTVGLSRVVYSTVGAGDEIATHLFDALFRWEDVGSATGDPSESVSEQIASLFARWIFPESGVEAYAEWSRLHMPSLRGLLVAPQLTQGYTLGLQWATPVRRTALARVQLEATSLDQTPSQRNGTWPSYYASTVVPQGYTQRGQVIGAAIGPGGSSQWIAADYVGTRWRLGLFGTRIRWEEDAYYRQRTGVGFWAHDVSMIGGVRGGVTLAHLDVALEWATTHRYNYLFQSMSGGYGPGSQFDLRNQTIRISIAPTVGLGR